MNYAIDNGFPKSTIIGITDLGKLIARPIDEYKYPTNGSRYTIQIMPSKQSKSSLSDFKGLEVKEVKTNNGYSYLYGMFTDKNAALEELERVKALGFTDASITKVESE